MKAAVGLPKKKPACHSVKSRIDQYSCQLLQAIPATTYSGCGPRQGLTITHQLSQLLKLLQHGTLSKQGEKQGIIFLRLNTG